MKILAPTRRRASSRAAATVRRGAAATEFALVLPLVMLLMLGAADLGRLGHSWVAVTNAARAGASYGGMTPVTAGSRSPWEAGIRQSVQDDLAQLRGFDAARLLVTTASETDADGRRRVRVTVEYPFDPLVTWAMMPASFQLRRSAVFPVIR